MVELATKRRSIERSTAVSRRAWVLPVCSTALIALAILYIHVPLLSNPNSPINSYNAVSPKPANVPQQSNQKIPDNLGSSDSLVNQVNHTILEETIQEGNGSSDNGKEISEESSSKQQHIIATGTITLPPTGATTAQKQGVTTIRASISMKGINSQRNATNIIYQRPAAKTPEMVPSPSPTTGSIQYPYSLDPVPATIDFTSWTRLGGGRFKEYTSGEGSPYPITDEIRQKSDDQARSRRLHIKNAMQFAWHGYEEHAFGRDELKPVSGMPGGGTMGTTLIDSLDTLWLMGLKDEFYRARDWVRDKLTYDQDVEVSVFETTIRSLGGLLSAYDWSQDAAFLEKAHQLGDRLFQSFDARSVTLPKPYVNLRSGKTSNPGLYGDFIIAEAATIQIEFRYLAKVTGDAAFASKTERVFSALNQISKPNGLFPYMLRDADPLPMFTNNKITFGAMGDSTYEYMLKVWIQGGRKEPMYRNMYDKAIQGMHDELLQGSTPSGLIYIADKDNDRLNHKMDHLVCFMGGLLALGAYTDPLGLESQRAQRDLTTAKALTYTCYQMYARTKTGISAEFVQFYAGKDFNIGQGAPHYLLRPEAVEAMFILSSLTKDPIYREWGWEIFSAIERYCKTEFAYGALSNVSRPNKTPRDSMESFMLGETLKYSYLLQDPDTEVDVLHKHVFNTEAHPMRILPLTTS